jgi:ABC-type multidrug transport system fused ATPase/permease subunit
VRSSASRIVVPAVVVLALVIVVAIASTGSTARGTSDTRPPADALLDVVFSLFLLQLAVAAGILIYGLTQRQAIAREMAKSRYRRYRFVSTVVVFAAFTLFVWYRLRDWERKPFVDEIGPQAFPTGDPPPERGTVEDQAYQAEFTWVPIIVVAALALVAFGAWYLATRRRRAEARQQKTLAEELAAAIDDSLDDLRAEPDPRKAVIAAYARLERVLAAHGFARNPSEAPGEYLSRLLPRLSVERGSVRRLTDLFTQAKFSTHDVDERMKDEAIDALSTVRDELRAAAERRREEQRAAGLEAAVGRP